MKSLSTRHDANRLNLGNDSSLICLFSKKISQLHVGETNKGDGSGPVLFLVRSFYLIWELQVARVNYLAKSLQQRQVYVPYRSGKSTHEIFRQDSLTPEGCLLASSWGWEKDSRISSRKPNALWRYNAVDYYFHY